MKNYKIFLLSVLMFKVWNSDAQNIPFQNYQVESQASTSNTNLNTYTSSNLTTTTSSTVGLSTSGGITVSSSGAAIYQVPFTLPTGIKGGKPSVGLAYNSQSSDGIAGWGWNITGLSSITRIPTTLYHDGFIDPVDFDSNDRYALDGQRLILKSGTYGANGSVYETESHSNVKVVAHGTSPYGSSYGPEYFIVYNPDGSRFWYGNSSNNRSKLEWAVSKMEDTQGNTTNYNHTNNAGVLLINTITYGAQSGQSAPNTIQFFYKDRKRNDYTFVGDFGFKNDNILDRVEIFSNGQLYRKYDLAYDYSSLDYERLSSITEQNSAYESLAPVQFAYDSTIDDLDRINQTFDLNSEISAQEENMINGDFDGDGKMDIVTYKKVRNTDEDKKIKLFKEIYDNNAIGLKKWIGTYDDLFTTTLLDANDKMMPNQGIIARKGDVFEFYDIGIGTTLKYSKQWNAPRYIKKSNDQQVLNITSPVNGGSSTESGFEVTASNIISNGANVDYKGADFLILKEGFHGKPGINFTGSTDPDSEGDLMPMDYLSGDFNGDGITDIMAITKPYSYKRNCRMEYDYWLQEEVEECDDYTYNHSDAHFINLDRRLASNFSKEAGRLSIPLGNDDRLVPADFDGDGKTDILHFTDGKVYVYKLTDQLTLQLIEEKPDTGIDLDFPILPGDYNGDGKSDFVIATADGSSIWKFFISTGENYTVFSKDIQVIYSEFSGGGSFYQFEGRNYGYPYPNGDEAVFEYHYIPTDFNNDGKTDIIYHKTITPLNFDTHSHQAVGIVANFGMASSGDINFNFTNYIESDNDGIKRFGIPVYLDVSTRRKGTEYAFITGDKIQAYDIKKDHQSDVSLVGSANNGIVTDITYSNLSKESTVYTAGTSQAYPFVDIANGASFKIVEEVTQNASSMERKQRFKYRGAVANFEGLGFIGFTKFSKTNWEGGNVGTLWTTTEGNPLNRNAPVKQWVVSGSSPSENEPTTFMSKVSYEYITTLSGSKVFINYPNKVITTNGLTNVITTENLTYDTYYNLLSTNSAYTGGSSTTTFTYNNNTGVSDANYHVGRPTKKVITKTLGSDTFSTEEQYTYTNNLVSEIKKKGNNTLWLTETFVYDIFGNITQKTLSGDGKSRTEKFKYSTDGRFMTEAEDIEGLKTTYVYNANNGHLISKTNPYGQTTLFEFDNWNRLIEEEDYLGNTITISYLGGSTGNLKRTTTNSIGGGEEVYVNRWGWETKIRVRNVNNEWVDVDYEYDILGRITRQSEPFKGGLRLWTQFYYDQYGRELSRTLPTGRVIDLTYNGLTGTVNDGVKTVTTTKDAAGNIVQVQDPGGTINYTYYANGANKTTDYGGHMITVDIDGWGRKTQMNDPSAGIYTYEYNIFGELTKETTPNGETTLTYDDFGKTLNRTIIGDETNITSTYQYDGATKLVTSMSSTDYINSKTFTYTYNYDLSGTHKGRLNFIEETTNHANYKKTFNYDSQGRITDETYYSKSLISNEDTTVKIKNHFHPQSGGVHKISDFNSGTILWEISTVNNRGQLTEVHLGNGIVKDNDYDQYGLPVSFKDEKTGTNGVVALELDLTFDVQRGNLTSRHNKAFTGSESFTYDNLDRLTQISGAISHTKTYDPFGRITNNSAVGDYTYQSQSRYKLEEIDLNTAGDTYYQNHALQQITYNAFKKPVDILEDTKGRVFFEYGPMMNRTVAYYGGLDSNKENLRYKKAYSSIMPVEIVYDNNNSSTKIITYVGGDAYTAPIAHIKEGTSSEYHYLHRDYLGSILSITDSSANIVEQTHFGAWGKVEQFSGNGATTFNYENSLLGRGYTGHEHFVSVGLIHMNGRMYDANLGRFLSPDNYIQDPYNSQSFNRFGYVWNNPLKFTDPTGEELFSIIVGALVGAWIGGSIANDGELNPFNWKWDGDTWKGVILGAILGAIAGESIHALLTGGKAFGIFTTKVSVLTPLGTVGLATNEARGLDFSWTTKAGGSGTIEDVIKFPEPKEHKVKAEAYVEGNAEDWEIMLRVPLIYNGIDSNEDALKHYFNGNGEPVNLGNITIGKLLRSARFQLSHERIILGLTSSLKGHFAVNLTTKMFHVGRTNINYSINCSGNYCTVTYRLFDGDGFWDPDFIDENTLGRLGIERFQPDGPGPNLERFGGTPYYYNPIIVTQRFPNPGY